MKNTVKKLLGASLLLTGFMANAVMAACYAIPQAYNPGNNTQIFEVDVASCPNKPNSSVPIQICTRRMGFTNWGGCLEYTLTPGENYHRQLSVHAMAYTGVNEYRLSYMYVPFRGPQYMKVHTTGTFWTGSLQ